MKNKRNHRGTRKTKRNMIDTLSSLYKTANKFYLEQIKVYNNLTLSDVDRLTGEDFELLLANLFTKIGYTVRTTPTTGDYGADLLLFTNNTVTVVQAKRYKSNVGVSAVQEIVSAKPMYSATHAMVVSNAEFTQQAHTLAQANNVRLIGRSELAKLLRQNFN